MTSRRRAATVFAYEVREPNRYGVRSGTPLEIFGDGSAVRDYLDADDLADAILLVAASKRPPGGVWNVDSGKGLSALEMVDLVGAAALPGRFRLVGHDAAQHEP